MTRRKRDAWDVAAEAFSDLDYQSEWLRCRARSHSFVEDAIVKKGRLLLVACICEHGCDVTLDQVQDENGYILSSHLNYPKGYTLKGTGRNRAEVKAAARTIYIDEVRKAMRHK